MDIQEDQQCGIEQSTPLASLDSALNELGMLASSASSRNEYLTDIKTHNYLNMLTINSRYVSNVSIGFRVRPSATRVRFKPFEIPEKKRHRTRSENNDKDTPSSLAQKIVEDCISESLAEISQLKKAKSLESIILEGNGNEDLKSIHFGSHNDLDQVSSGVQKLKVVE